MVPNDIGYGEPKACYLALTTGENIPCDVEEDLKGDGYGRRLFLATPRRPLKSKDRVKSFYVDVLPARASIQVKLWEAK